MIVEPDPFVAAVLWVAALGSITGPDRTTAVEEALVSATMLMWGLAWAPVEVVEADRQVLRDGAMERLAEQPWALARLFKDALSRATRTSTRFRVVVVGS